MKCSIPLPPLLVGGGTVAQEGKQVSLLLLIGDKLKSITTFKCPLPVAADLPRECNLACSGHRQHYIQETSFEWMEPSGAEHVINCACVTLEVWHYGSIWDLENIRIVELMHISMN